MGLDEDILHINKLLDFDSGLVGRGLLYFCVSIYLPNNGSDPDKPHRFAHLQRGCNIISLAPSIQDWGTSIVCRSNVLRHPK